MPLIVVLALAALDSPQRGVQVALEVSGELSLSPGTVRGVQVDGLFGPSLSVALPLGDRYWFSLILGGRAGTLGGRDTGATPLVDARSRDGVVDLRLHVHVPLEPVRGVELRVGPVLGVGFQLIERFVRERSTGVHALSAVEAGARVAVVWGKLVFSWEIYGFITLGTLPARAVSAWGAGFAL